MYGMWRASCLRFSAAMLEQQVQHKLAHKVATSYLANTDGNGKEQHC